MLNRAVETDASVPEKGKWRFDRATKEWVCDAPPAPKVVPAPKVAAPVAPVAPVVPVAVVAAVAFSTSQNGPGLAYVAPAVFNTQVATPCVPTPVGVAKPKRTARDLLHPDVVLPLVAALIVLILFLAWAA